MFGARDEDHRRHWGAGGFGRHGRGQGGGHRGDHGHGRGGGDWFRVGRMLAHGDLKLLTLALIEDQPRHGYELIKLIEERTSGAYSPSPGVVYPTLTFLEEAGYATAASEGAKKTYAITDAGRDYLKENREFADMILERLAAIGKKFERKRRGWDGDEAGNVPKLVEAALDNLRATAIKQLEKDADSETTIVEILARAAKDIRNG
jgi:DNA-binding PadR family transcriptional regulator